MQEFKLPDLGEGMHEAEVVQWLIKPGDTIKLDQTLPGASLKFAYRMER